MALKDTGGTMGRVENQRDGSCGPGTRETVLLTPGGQGKQEETASLSKKPVV